MGPGATFRLPSAALVDHCGKKQEKDNLLASIRRLQHGLCEISQTKELPCGKRARWWPVEVYFDKEPQPTEGSCGEHDFRGWCIGVSQFLGPQARMAELSGKTEDLTLALEMAHGFLGGYEHRRGSTAPMFGENGAFRGHFHSVVSGLDGLLRLAVLLYRRGETEQAVEWLEQVRRVYAWIFDTQKKC